MKYGLILTLLLVGCTSVPVKQPWPQIPEEIRYTCNDLDEIQIQNPKLTDVLDVVVENYAQYYECQAKVDAWIEWYDEQKRIHDEVNK